MTPQPWAGPCVHWPSSPAKPSPLPSPATHAVSPPPRPVLWLLHARRCCMAPPGGPLVTRNLQCMQLYLPCPPAIPPMFSICGVGAPGPLESLHSQPPLTRAQAPELHVHGDPHTHSCSLAHESCSPGRHLGDFLSLHSASGPWSPVPRGLWDLAELE